MLSKIELAAIVERQNDSYLYSYRHKPFDDIDALLQHIRELEADYEDVWQRVEKWRNRARNNFDVAKDAIEFLQQHGYDELANKFKVRLLKEQTGAGGGDE